MQQVTFDGLDLVGNGYNVLSPMQGLDFPALSVNSYERSGTDGIRTTAIFMRERRIALNGLIQGDCDELTTLRQGLINRSTPSRINNVLQSKTLDITDLDGTQYTLFVKALGLSMPRTSFTKSIKYQLDLVADDPLIYSSTLNQERVDISTLGYLSFPISFPFSFVLGSDGSIVVTNSGNQETYPTITIFGPIESPTILNDTTGEFVYLQGLSVAAGSSLVIDMRNRTIVQGGTTNRLSYLTDDSRFFTLVPGENHMVLTSSSPASTGYAIIEWRDAFGGL